MQDSSSGWCADLRLGFSLSGNKTSLSDCQHSGPLRVQKALYPEGEAVCHALILHPPGGIVGGDHLDIDVRLESGSHALLTTPGATKWYRSGGRVAQQRIYLQVAADAVLEWLPQETIVYTGAEAIMQTQVTLAAGALYCGWETLCLGRTASGERFDTGYLSLLTRLQRGGENEEEMVSHAHEPDAKAVSSPLWVEQGQLPGAGQWLQSTTACAGRPVLSTLWLAGKTVQADWLAACRAIISPPELLVGVTAVQPEVLVARCLSPDSERAKAWLLALWQVLRPRTIGRDAVEPRIWHT